MKKKKYNYAPTPNPPFGNNSKLNQNPVPIQAANLDELDPPVKPGPINKEQPNKNQFQDQRDLHYQNRNPDIHPWIQEKSSQGMAINNYPITQDYSNAMDTPVFLNPNSSVVEDLRNRKEEGFPFPNQNQGAQNQNYPGVMNYNRNGQEVLFGLNKQGIPIDINQPDKAPPINKNNNLLYGNSKAQEREVGNVIPPFPGGLIPGPRNNLPDQGFNIGPENRNRNFNDPSESRMENALKNNADFTKLPKFPIINDNSSTSTNDQTMNASFGINEIPFSDPRAGNFNNINNNRQNFPYNFNNNLNAREIPSSLNYANPMLNPNANQNNANNYKGNERMMIPNNFGIENKMYKPIESDTNKCTISEILDNQERLGKNQNLPPFPLQNPDGFNFNKNVMQNPNLNQFHLENPNAFNLKNEAKNQNLNAFPQANRGGLNKNEIQNQNINNFPPINPGALNFNQNEAKNQNYNGFPPTNRNFGLNQNEKPNQNLNSLPQINPAIVKANPNQIENQNLNFQNMMGPIEPNANINNPNIVNPSPTQEDIERQKDFQYILNNLGQLREMVPFSMNNLKFSFNNLKTNFEEYKKRKPSKDDPNVTLKMLSYYNKNPANQNFGNNYLNANI